MFHPVSGAGGAHNAQVPQSHTPGAQAQAVHPGAGATLSGIPRAHSSVESAPYGAGGAFPVNAFSQYVGAPPALFGPAPAHALAPRPFQEPAALAPVHAAAPGMRAVQTDEGTRRIAAELHLTLAKVYWYDTHAIRAPRPVPAHSASPPFASGSGVWRRPTAGYLAYCMRSIHAQIDAASATHIGNVGGERAGLQLARLGRYLPLMHEGDRRLGEVLMSESIQRLSQLASPISRLQSVGMMQGESAVLSPSPAHLGTRHAVVAGIGAEHAARAAAWDTQACNLAMRPAQPRVAATRISQNPQPLDLSVPPPPARARSRGVSAPRAAH